MLNRDDLCKENINNKIRNTNMERYGVDSPFKRKDVRDKIKLTNLIKFGFECNLQNEENKNKVKKTVLKKYNCEHIMQSEIIKERLAQTNIKKYGVKSQIQRPEIKEQIKQTNLRLYGVEHSCQNKEIHEKQVRNSYSTKKYKLPSGNIIKIQGYEPFALNELLNSFDETEIITGSKNVPDIWYFDEKDKKHRHFVDIFIPKINKCIEIKSIWTFNVSKKTVLLKQEAGKKLGYLYEIWVFDKNGVKIGFYD
jgi:hypothetical protein